MKVLLISIVFLLSSTVFADTMESYEFNDADKEARYKALIQELRCLVCQNQNLADSNAPLALDLRRQTYEMVVQGKTNEDVVEYMVTRYGDFVLYRPRFNTMNALLWLGPFLLLLSAVLVAIMIIRKGPQDIDGELSASDHERAKTLLESGSETKKTDEGPA